MTPQEQQMIQSLADRINNTPLAEKDPDAEGFLQQSLGRNPDALYILAQTTLVQQYALEQAQKQLADLRAQLDQQRQPAEPRHATSFLGNLLGHHDDPAPQNPPAYRTSPVSYAPGAGSSFSRPAPPPPPPPPYGQPYYEQPQYGPPPPPYGAPQSGGFLRSAMQTAAGVAAGALAFEGVESLMHGFGGGGGGFSSGVGGGRPEEIINNYYGDSSPSEHKEHLSSDIEDRRDQSGFSDAVDRDDHNYKEGLSGTDTDDPDTTDDSDTGTDDISDSSFDDTSSSDDFSSSFGDDSN